MTNQLTLFPLVPTVEGIEGKIDSSPTDFVGEPAPSSPTGFVGELKKQWLIQHVQKDKSEGGKGFVNQYVSPKNGKSYFRYSYRLGNQIKTVHIPGGNVTVKLAIQRADIIKQMVNRGASTPEILNTISAFKKH